MVRKDSGRFCAAPSCSQSRCSLKKTTHDSRATAPFSGTSTQAQAAFVYGAGADVNLSKHLFLRAKYRGFVYNSPTYDMPALGGLDRVTHRAEPSIGFGWRF
jgi:opacity protein-like surface antigen